jgi:heat shock protein HslJ
MQSVENRVIQPKKIRMMGLLSLLLMIFLTIGCESSEATSTQRRKIENVNEEPSINDKNIHVTAAPLANTPWILTSFENPQLNPLLDVNQVTIHFDIDGSSVSGKSACNDYFASYEVDGNNLLIHELGTLMMICDETKMRIEDAFFESLAKATGYRIEGESLILTYDDEKMMLRFIVAPYTKSVYFTREELANAIYQTEFVETGQVTLVNSEFRGEAEASSAPLIVQLTYHMAFGDLDGDDIEEAAVVLVTNAGGSGVFYDLAVVKKKERELNNIAITSLGERILVRDVVIQNRVIHVDMLVSSAEHITCCPDAPAEKRYRLDSDILIMEE